jgi:hypothetical protein
MLLRVASITPGALDAGSGFGCGSFGRIMKIGEVRFITWSVGVVAELDALKFDLKAPGRLLDLVGRNGETKEARSERFHIPSDADERRPLRIHINNTSWTVAPSLPKRSIATAMLFSAIGQER